MSSETLVYIATGWLILTAGPICVALNVRVNRLVKKARPDAGLGLRLFPYSKEIHALVKEDGTYQKLLWAVIASAVVFFALLYVAKLKSAQ